MFAKETYLQRREKLRKTVGSGIILLLGNEESPMNYADNPFRFRQDSTFLYFFGMDHPFLAGVLDCDTGEDWIFGNDLTVEDFVWMGPQPTIADQATHVGVKKTAPVNTLVELLGKTANTGERFIFCHPTGQKTRSNFSNGWDCCLQNSRKHLPLN